MKPGVQSFLKSMGNESCYFQCLFETARLLSEQIRSDLEFPVFEDLTITHIVTLVNKISLDKNRYMDFNMGNFDDDSNFYVRDAPALVKFLIKYFINEDVEVGYSKELNLQKVSPNWVWFEEWKWKNQHFRFHDVDSLQNSYTVRNGKFVSYRCFYLK